MVHRLATVNIDRDIPKILVIHRDPGRYDAFKAQNNDPEPAYTIGRSMFETDRIPEDWPPKCRSEVDEIWFPSHFNQLTFNASGVPASMLRVVPEPIDVRRYDPAFVTPLPLPVAKGFTFLSVGKWEERKGFALLLEAYFTAFTEEDNVILYLRSGVSDADYEKVKEEASAKAVEWRHLMAQSEPSPSIEEAEWYPPEAPPTPALISSL